MQIIHTIPVFGTPLFNAVEQMQFLIQPSARRVALMADHHLGYSMPIGGVAAYEGKVSPSGVGFDIACGNKAARLSLTPDQVADVRLHMPDIMNDIWNRISFGIGHCNDNAPDHSLFDEHLQAWAVIEDISKEIDKGKSGLKDMARGQLGTVGGGNHYVDIFADEQDRIWVGVHFGSRGLGHKIAGYFIKHGGGKDGMNVAPVLLDEKSELGIAYIRCMELAGAYAYAGRDWVCQRVAQIIGAPIIEEVHNHHNYAWQEMVDDEPMWVVRKGATPAFPGQKGFIGGSMGENAVIVQGEDTETARQALRSTVHGAGRVLSRSEAKGKTDRHGNVKKEGAVTQEMMDSWIRDAGIVLRGGNVDESPHCYKRLTEVLAHHDDSISILHTLKPLGVAMAGPETNDPYKD
jgi:tRNA-splicing ligase RtcB